MLDPNRNYTLKEIVEDIQPFPWAKTYPAVKNLIEADRKGKNILKAALIKGDNSDIRGFRRWYIKGENILNYLKSKGL